MSSLALMRLLESAPERYDAGMRFLTLGRAGRIQDALAEAAAPGPGARVLEIGCGTGAVTARLLARGARVTAIDQNPEMLARAQARLEGAEADRLVLLERTAAEIDALGEGDFDAVAASFSLSEMAAGERAFVLREAVKRLRPGGVLALADEVLPRGAWRRGLFALVRGPQAALGWLLVGSTSHAIRDLAAETREAGVGELRERRWLGGTLALVVGVKPGEKP